MVKRELIRLTLMLEKKNEAKLRQLQAKKIARTNQGVSFSQIVNDVLKKAL